MPIPGDNGHPKEEREAQDKRIQDVCDTGANVRKEVKFYQSTPKEKTIFGEI